MNVNDIMTRLPSQSEEEIHWRAVPSLREIWAEERQRMATLLPPKDNFLSGENNGSLSFTLSVKKGAPAPGFKLAAEGNSRLFDCSPTLQGDFDKAMIDIIQKHKNNLEVLSNSLKKSEEIVMNRSSGVKMNDKEKQQQNLSQLLAPKKDDALLALEGLLNQFSSTYPSSMSSKEEIVHDFGPSVFTPSKSFKLSQLQPHVPSLTQLELEEVEEELEFCRETEKGHLAFKENMDPSTLTPHDEDEEDNDFDEEHLMEEEEFEKHLTMLGTQQVHSLPESLSQLDSVVNSWSCSQSKSELEVLPLAQDSISSEDQVKSLSPNVVEKQHCTPKEGRRMLSLLSESPAIVLKGGETIELKVIPPTTSQFLVSSPVRLHPNNQNPDLPAPWLGYGTRSLDEIHSFRYDVKRWQGYFLQPVKGPPSSRRVRKWVQKKRKLSLTSKNANFSRSKRRKHAKNDKDSLEFDSNTRKLLRVKTKSKRKRRVAFAEDHQIISSSTMALIEEVNWTQGSQDLTQDSTDTTPSKSNKPDKDTDSAQIQSSDETKENTYSTMTPIKSFTIHSDSPQKSDPLQGIGQQGGRIHVEGGGGLKASVITNKILQKQLSMMSIEVHVQCRTGKAGVNNSTEIAMRPDPTRDSIFAVCYVYSFDPGGGEQIKVKERGCIFVPTENEISTFNNSAKDKDLKQIIPRIGKTMGVSSHLKIEAVPNEKQLLLRIASIVQWKDPDALFSWDTQSLGLGYLIERGLALGRNENEGEKKSIKVDMVRLLGRTPKRKPSKKEDLITTESEEEKDKQQWTGSGLGAEWDDKVGAGAAPSSIVSNRVRSLHDIVFICSSFKYDRPVLNNRLEGLF